LTSFVKILASTSPLTVIHPELKSPFVQSRENTDLSRSFHGAWLVFSDRLSSRFPSVFEAPHHRHQTRDANQPRHSAVDEHLILIEMDLSPSGYSESCSFSSIPHFDHCILAKNAVQFGKTVKQ
jgi:hypothetical protein